MNLFTMTECLYEVINDRVKVIACRGLDHAAVIPEFIEGYPVTELAPYAFSESRREALHGSWTSNEERDANEELPLLQGNELWELHLPSSMKKIGAYAFYNCMKWEKFYFYTTLTDLGAGVFTGCKSIHFMDVTVVQGQKSGLQEILFELHQQIHMVYHAEETARLIFPEFFEEAVENTPARILETKTHGCGHCYRYCFYGSEFQFKDYDSLLYHLTIEEQEPLVVELVLGRLQYPYHLGEAAGAGYRVYLEKHKMAALSYVIASRDMKQLKWFLEIADLNREETEEAVAAAGRIQNTEALSFLMDYRHWHFKSQKKKFLL